MHVKSIPKEKFISSNLWDMKQDSKQDSKQEHSLQERLYKQDLNSLRFDRWN